MKCRIRLAAGHLKTVLTHKYWVFRYAFTAGIPVRGLLHDLSKFSPAEWGESIRYYTGKRSPIRDARAENGYSLTWIHHRGRNRHHFEYWLDNRADGGLTVVPMPFFCALELICDRLGAGRAYRKKNFTLEEQVFRFHQDIESSPLVHPQTKRFVGSVFIALNEAPDKQAFKKILRNARTYYDRAWEETFRDSANPDPQTLLIHYLLPEQVSDFLSPKQRGMFPEPPTRD